MKYLLNGLTALALGLVTVGCSSNDDFLSKEDIVNHANQQLGIKIDPKQDWTMISEANASITVNQDYGETYSVKILRNNPLSGVGYVLASGKIANGDTFKTKFTYPKGTASFMVGITNSKGYTIYKPVYVMNGELQTSFGRNTHTVQHVRRAATTRAVTSMVDDYGFDVAEVPDVTFTADDVQRLIPNPVVINEARANDNSSGSPNYTLDFLIPAGTTWNQYIPVLGSEDWDDWEHQVNGVPTKVRAHRNVLVQGRWVLAAQNGYGGNKLGGGGIVIVDNGGEIVIPKDMFLGSDNGFRVVVMPGGKISGEGGIAFHNGSGNSFDYNGGTIEVGWINNNGGNVHNYGDLRAETLMGGAGLSCYYNHGKMTIGESATGSGSANTRIYNACWFECEGMLEARDMILGDYSYLHTVRLQMSVSEDGTKDPVEVLLGSGAYLKVDEDASFNNVSFVGPTDDVYSVIELGSVSFYTYTSYYDPAVNAQVPSYGVVVNNIALSIESEEDIDQESWVTYNQWNPSPYEKMAIHMLNGGESDGFPVQGNGNAVLVDIGSAPLNIEESDCTPGYQGEPGGGNTRPQVYTYAFEDTKDGDYDMNDCVFQVWEDPDDDNYYYIQPVACGARADIIVYLDDEDIFNGIEFHSLFQNSASAYYINTCTYADEKGLTCNLIEPVRKEKPEGFSFMTADFWIDASTWPEPEGIHIAHEGDSPFGIIVPDEWEWPSERTCINVAYSGFDAWAQDVTYEDGFNWYTSGEGQNIYDGRPLRYSLR